MLKRVTLKNFVNFKKAQTLKFGKPGDNGGVFMFVGANGSGKSTVFEAIRRCSEVRINDSISTRDKDNDSLAMCLYENPENGDTMASYYMVWKNENEHATGSNDGSTDSGSKDAAAFVAIKVLITRVKNESDYALVWSGWSDEDSMDFSWRPYILGTSDKDKLLNFKPAEDGDTQYDGILKILKVIQYGQKDHVVDAEFDHKFQSFTDIEFLFGHRGISPIQSSKQLDNTEGLSPRESRYEEGTKNAYIIRHFLETRQLYDTDIKKEIFGLITSEGDEFTLDDNQQIVFGPEKAPLLKISEGIVEAECISILLSKRATRTLILEEPGRGMHKNYVDSMVNTVFPDDRFTENKTIILSTHNQDFLTPRTLCSTFFFKRNDNGDSEICQLTGQHNKKTRTFITYADASNIFFSKRTLFVEGQSDSLFVTMIKEILLQNANLAMKICDENNEDAKKFKEFLATLSIVRLDGAGEVQKTEDICNDLGITSRLYLFDEDQEKQLNKRKLKEGVDYFMWKCECREEEMQDHPRKEKHKPGENKFEATLSIVRQGGDNEEDEMKKADDICKKLGNTKRESIDEFLKEKLLEFLKEGDDRTSICLLKYECQSKEEEPQKRKGDLEDVLLNQARKHDEMCHPAEGESDRSCKFKFDGCEGMRKHKMLYFTSGEKKALLQQDLSQDDTTKEMRRVIEEAVDYKETEVWRFLDFLKKKSKV